MENPAFSKICRTCMSNGQDFHSFLEYESVSKLRIGEMLMTTVPQLHIQPEIDILPFEICGMCLDKLIIAYDYLQLCIQTDKSLKAMLLHDVGEENVDQQKEKEKHQIIETNQTNMLLQEINADTVVQNPDTELELQLTDIFISIDNESDCDDFFYALEQDEDSLFKAMEAVTAEDGGDTEYNSKAKWNDKKTDEDKIDINSIKPTPKATESLCSHQNETDVNEIEKLDDRNDNKKEFVRPYHLRCHAEANSIKLKFECDVCKYRSLTENELNLHKTTHINDVSAKEKTPPDAYQCEYCPKKFKKCTLLAKHAATHPENKKFKCSLCEKTFSFNAHLIEHLKEHVKLRKFRCKHCDKVFQQNASLKEHMNTHTGETPHLCPQCGKSFKHRSTMRQHLLRHSDEKRFRCEECPSRFACPSDLNKHMAVHRTCNVHICDICGSSVARLSTLKKHKLQHSGKRPHKCKECEMSFVFAHHLRSHMRTHTGQKPHKCKYCAGAFAERGDLNKHLRTHIGENTYMCDDCPKAFKYKKDLQFHQVQHFKQQLELEAKKKVSAPKTSPITTAITKEYTENENSSS